MSDDVKLKPKCLASQNANTYIEDAASAIVVPERHIALDYLQRDHRVNRIQEAPLPSERFKLLLRSMFFPKETGTHESRLIWQITVLGGAGSFLLGGLLNSTDIHEQYMRKNNASVFSGKYVANRHFWDTLVSGCAARGLKYGVRAAILCFAASFVGLGSTVYRNKVYLPDFLVGFSTIGALSRLWIGPRGMAGGAMIGGITGLGAYGLLRLLELASNQTFEQMKSLGHKEYMSRKEERHKEMLLLQEESAKKYLYENYYDREW